MLLWKSYDIRGLFSLISEWYVNCNENLEIRSKLMFSALSISLRLGAIFVFINVKSSFIHSSVQTFLRSRVRSIAHPFARLSVDSCRACVLTGNVCFQDLKEHSAITYWNEFEPDALNRFCATQVKNSKFCRKCTSLLELPPHRNFAVFQN